MCNLFSLLKKKCKKILEARKSIQKVAYTPFIEKWLEAPYSFKLRSLFL